MNEEKLSKRLKTVASYIKKDSHIADIGSDHAYLPCHVILHQMARFAVAGEVVEGPFESAKNQVHKLALTNQITVRKGDGLAVIRPEDQIDTIVIAGMGGALIRSILEKDPNKLNSVRRLILQPNIAAWQLRAWAEENDYQIIAESILKEDHKIYEIIVLEKTTKPITYSESERLLGPKLIAENSPVFREKWNRERATWQTILQNIAAGSSVTTENKERIKELKEKIQIVEDVFS
ncbi:tRNA (adenine(22)-N(1))-methyltransferase TrmK [Listeria sp. PSOL-1]|uniref:tRNA (adenine(22)-N(1))-methyltransferase n=1 Tax=Listeria sp. PSOL-1 TaxID=1844999 RepID=UPI0013D56523|nr:tRNA (adenine(22)-N(1))-methyltransferase TrmK [Listeria sp. PSOL-1]